MTMTRTTVYLPLDAKRRLSAAAHRQHRSEAELIRDAVSRLLAEEPESPRPNPPRFDDELRVIEITPHDYRRMAELLTTYSSLRLQAVDACVVPVAERLDLHEVAALDRRDFQVVAPRHLPKGQRLKLLPED
jgi:predicted nucleic acid-binding protein